VRPEFRRFVSARWHGIPVGLFVSYLALLGISFGAVFAYVPARSLVWHVANGRVARIGENRLELPLMWWRESKDPSAFVVRHARFGTLDASDLHFLPLPAGKIPQDDDAARKWQLALKEAINGSRESKVVAISINAPVGTIFCVRGTSSRVVTTLLLCQTARVPWGIAFSGLKTEEESAESILSTLK
jgi:hypothetical protein